MSRTRDLVTDWVEQQMTTGVEAHDCPPPTVSLPMVEDGQSQALAIAIETDELQQTKVSMLSGDSDDSGEDPVREHLKRVVEAQASGNLKYDSPLQRAPPLQRAEMKSSRPLPPDAKSASTSGGSQRPITHIDHMGMGSRYARDTSSRSGKRSKRMPRAVTKMSL